MRTLWVSDGNGASMWHLADSRSETHTHALLTQILPWLPDYLANQMQPNACALMWILVLKASSA